MGSLPLAPPVKPINSESVQFSSVTQSCPTLCEPMNHSTPGLLVYQPTPRVHPNPCPLSQRCHPIISSSVVPFSSHLHSFPASGSLQMSQFCRWPKYWSFSFSISPSNVDPGLISFRMDWFGSPCSPRDSQESSPTPQFKSINSLALSFL